MSPEVLKREVYPRVVSHIKTESNRFRVNGNTDKIRKRRLQLLQHYN